jgi:hypothetical protein
MLDSEHYMTMGLLEKTVAEFTWPLPYHLENDLPDGIVLSFPASHFYFREGVDRIEVEFLSTDTGGYSGLMLFHALSVFVPLSQRGQGGIASVTPGLTDTEGWSPSKETTQEDIRNLCKIILAHLTPVIEGDFSWVDAFLKTSFPSNRGVVEPRPDHQRDTQSHTE